MDKQKVRNALMVSQSWISQLLDKSSRGEIPVWKELLEFDLALVDRALKEMKKIDE